MAGTQDDDEIAINMEKLSVDVNGGEYDPNSPMASSLLTLSMTYYSQFYCIAVQKT